MKARVFVSVVLLALASTVSYSRMSSVSPLEHPPEFIPLKMGDGDAIAVSRTEVTVAQWRECIADQMCPEIKLSKHAAGDHPMTNISYYDVLSFLAWYAKRTGDDVRLPTQAEWIALAAEDAPKPRKKLFDDPNLAWAADYDIESERKSLISSSVGHYGTNSVGVADIRGNVWEWTATCASDTDAADCFGGRIAMGEHEARLSSLVRDPAKAGCGGGVPPSLLGFRIVSGT